eukprot:gb/GECG01011417.1/.p1 GENE.gb/GECG01011417.1/~~gb/GECG01011417.1/.p1  ORF type:complete len:100 (+),score=5.02 gb/GECG01011417.1/:1-300(+)
MLGFHFADCRRRGRGSGKTFTLVTNNLGIQPCSREIETREQLAAGSRSLKLLDTLYSWSHRQFVIAESYIFALHFPPSERRITLHSPPRLPFLCAWWRR